MLAVLLALLVACVVGVLLMNYFGFGGMIRTTDIIQQIKPILSGVRMSIFMVIYFYWDSIASYLRKRYSWNDDQLTRVSAHKHSMLMFVVFVELVLVNNIPKLMIGVFSG